MTGRFISLLLVTSLACVMLSSASVDTALSSCIPSVVQAGDVVLLTIAGQLPPGALTAEFYPQRIQVLNLVAIDAQTVTIQIAVPADAPAGPYNILLYNQQGAEALGSGLLEIVRPAHAPRIASAAPLELEAALEEFRLTLHCTTVEADAIAHLSVEWSRSGSLLGDITNQFELTNLDTIALTVRGQMLPGEVLGKVFFDKTPIFLIRLKRVDQGWSLFGHRPTRIVNDAPGCQVQFLGQGLSPLALAGSTVTLARDGTPLAEAALDWQDSARAVASFSPIPAPGEYALSVTKKQVVLYQGPLLVVDASAADQPVAPVKEGSAEAKPAPSAKATPKPAGPRPRTRQPLPDWQAARQASRPGAGAEHGMQPVPAQPSIRHTVSQTGMSQAAVRSARQTGIHLSAIAIAKTQEICRLELRGPGLRTANPEAYSAVLVAGDRSATLMFISGQQGGLLLLFRAPAAGWGQSQTYVLRLSDSQTGEQLDRWELPVR